MKPPSALANASPNKRFAWFGATYVALWIASWYGAGLLASKGTISLWFLPAALRFFGLLVFGWQGVLLESVVQAVFALLQLTGIAGTPISSLFSSDAIWRLYNLLGSLAANALVALPLRHLLRGRWNFTEPAHTALFLGAALVACALSALAGTFGFVRLVFIEPDQFAAVSLTWLIGDFVAIITLAPLLLLRVAPGLQHLLKTGHWSRRHAPNRASADLVTTLVASLALLLLFALPRSLGLHPNFPLLALLLLLPLAGIALVQGLYGSLLAVALLDGGLVLLLAFFQQRGEALQYQAVMIAIAFSGLCLGGLVDARKKLIARYRDFSSVSNDLLWEADPRGCLIEVGGRLAHRVDLSLGRHWRSLLARVPQAELNRLELALEQRQPFRNIEVALSGRDDEMLWIQLNGLPLFDETGAFDGYRGTAVDVSRPRRADALLRGYTEKLEAEVAARTSELRHSHDALQAKERHLEVVLAAVPVGVIELDSEQRCRYINANGCALTGYRPEEAIGHGFLDFVHADERSHVDFVWNINRHSSDVHWLEFKLAHTDLRCAAHWIKMAPASGSADATASGTIVVLSNATARSQHDERLWTLAHHDALTDLPNRHLFWDRARQALLHAKRDGSSTAILCIDLDGFKAVNDRLGHAAGDALLQQVAHRLKCRMRDSDTVARIGGDEFAVVLPGLTDAGDALTTAQALLASVAQPFALPQGSAQISSSIGVALYPEHAQTAETLAQCADVAMYLAKNSGKNKVRLAATDT